MFLNNKETTEKEKKEYNYSSEPQEPVFTHSRVPAFVQPI